MGLYPAILATLRTATQATTDHVTVCRVDLLQHGLLKATLAAVPPVVVRCVRGPAAVHTCCVALCMRARCTQELAHSYSMTAERRRAMQPVPRPRVPVSRPVRAPTQMPARSLHPPAPPLLPPTASPFPVLSPPPPSTATSPPPAAVPDPGARRARHWPESTVFVLGSILGETHCLIEHCSVSNSLSSEAGLPRPKCRQRCLCNSECSCVHLLQEARRLTRHCRRARSRHRRRLPAHCRHRRRR